MSETRPVPRTHLNPDDIVGIVPLMPQGTNSTMFTACCRVAICGDQGCCPRCNRTVIGADADTRAERERIRWGDATRAWSRRRP